MVDGETLLLILKILSVNPEDFFCIRKQCHPFLNRRENHPAFDGVMAFSLWIFYLLEVHKIDVKYDSVISYCLFYTFKTFFVTEHRQATVLNSNRIKKKCL